MHWLANEGAIRLRHATSSDTADVDRLYRMLVLSQVDVRSERIQQIADDVNSLLLLAEVGATIAGTSFVTFGLDPMHGERPFAVVENLIVDPRYRRQGIARALFKALDDAVVARNATKLMLLSGVERVEAHQFFEELGFSGVRKRAFVRYRSDIASN